MKARGLFHQTESDDEDPSKGSGKKDRAGVHFKKIFRNDIKKTK